jgi:Uma2 family endonuclease
MSATVEKTRYTPEDLLRLPDDGKSYELINGELVERKIGWDSSYIGGRLGRFLGVHCEGATFLGWVAPADAGYQCFPDDPDKVRFADVSFIRAGRFPGGQRPRGHCRIAPDLAVEVISPNESLYDVEEKVADYLAAGVRLVWVIVPPRRIVHVYRADGTGGLVRETGELDGEDVVPGFRCKVADLFVDPTTPPG